MKRISDKIKDMMLGAGIELDSVLLDHEAELDNDFISDVAELHFVSDTNLGVGGRFVKSIRLTDGNCNVVISTFSESQSRLISFESSEEVMKFIVDFLNLSKAEKKFNDIYNTGVELD